MNKVDWDMLSKNTNAIHILEKNLDRVHWIITFSLNPNAVHILEKEENSDKINWGWLSQNPSLFIETYDIKKISESPHKELLAMKAFNPKRIHKYLKLGYDPLEL